MGIPRKERFTFPLEWGESGETSQGRRYMSWNLNLWTLQVGGGVEKVSLVEETYEQKHRARKVQGTHRCCKQVIWAKGGGMRLNGELGPND